MTKKFILPLLAIFLLSSCANKFSLQKRKYTKGFYLGISGTNSAKKNNIKPSHLKVKETPLNLPTETLETEIVTATTDLKPVNNEQVKTSVSSHKVSSPKETQRSEKPVQLTVSADKKMIVAKKDIKKLPVNTSDYNSFAKKGESGAKLVIMVILCLFPFINLIPVYIHDGSVTLNFWITLLLCFTLLGGVIFALLVVLDVVDLA